jgi:E3 ubiquitin-protein ligase listerin
MTGSKLHHLPSLFLHPSRRIRLVTASLHYHFLSKPANRAEFISQLHGIDAQQSEILIGAWCLAACDLDRHVSREARKSFNDLVAWPSNSIPGSDSAPGKSVLNDTLGPSLAGFLTWAILDPTTLYASIYASPTIAAALSQLGDRHANLAEGVADGNTTPRRADAEEETTEEMQSRFRIGALGGVKWILGQLLSSNRGLSFATKKIH